MFRRPVPPDDCHTLVFMELWKDAALLDRARWCASWLSRLEIKPAKLSWRREGDTIAVRCHSGIAIGVAFDGDFVPEDNCFDLLPGEARTIRLNPPGGESAPGKAVSPYACRGQFSP